MHVCFLKHKYEMGQKDYSFLLTELKQGGKWQIDDFPKLVKLFLKICLYVQTAIHLTDKAVNNQEIINLT